MPPILRIPALLLALVGAVSGCAPPAPTTSGGNRAPQLGTAWFAAPPERLIEAARAACDGPGETFVLPRPGVVQCRLFLDPQTTAAVILNHDGDINALPQLVVSLATMRAREGYLVTGCAFLRVPHKDGRTSRIAQNHRAVAGKLREMLRKIGGKPVRETPPELAEQCFAL